MHRGLVFVGSCRSPGLSVATFFCHCETGGIFILRAFLQKDVEIIDEPRTGWPPTGAAGRIKTEKLVASAHPIHGDSGRHICYQCHQHRPRLRLTSRP